MHTTATRLSILLACAVAIGCDAELKVGDFDGSVFPDGGDEDGGGTGGDAGTAGTAGTGGSAGTAGTAGTGGSAGTGGVGEDVSDVPQLLANAVCAALTACDGAQLLADSLNGENCADITGSVFSARELSALSDSVAAGRITFDRTRMASCIASITSQSCDVQTSRRPAACEEAIRGRVALGGDCVISEDCSGTTSYCAAQAQCPGECRALLNMGAECTNSDHCANGLLCAVLEGVRQCVAPGNPGAYCGYDDTPLCKRGNTCTPNVGDDDTCKANSVVYGRAAGQSCDPATGSFCERDLACTNTPGGLTCAAIAARDGACFRAQPSHCPAGQYCDAETGMAGTCVDLPEDNEVCLPVGRSQRCAPGFVCLGTTEQAAGFCQIKGENGDNCTDDAQCYSGNCDGTVCEPPASLCSL